MTLDKTVNDCIFNSLRLIGLPEGLLGKIKGRFRPTNGHVDITETHTSPLVNSDVKIYLRDFKGTPQKQTVLKLSLFGNYPVTQSEDDTSLNSFFDYVVGELVHNAQKQFAITVTSGKKEYITDYKKGVIAVRARMKPISGRILESILAKPVFDELGMSVDDVRDYFVIDVVDSGRPDVPAEERGFSKDNLRDISLKAGLLKAAHHYSAILERLKAGETVGSYTVESVEQMLKNLRKGVKPNKAGTFGVPGTVAFVERVGGIVKYGNARDNRWYDNTPKNGIDGGWWSEYGGAHIRVYFPAEVLVKMDEIRERVTSSGRLKKVEPKISDTTQFFRESLILPIGVDPSSFEDPDDAEPAGWA